MLRERMAGVIERVLTRESRADFHDDNRGSDWRAGHASGCGGGRFRRHEFHAGSTASTSLSTPILTAMSTSKSFLATAVAVALLSIPVGYHFGSDTESQPELKRESATPKTPKRISAGAQVFYG
jgi:hypothetical protein